MNLRGILQGFAIAYLKYAPPSTFKTSFIEGLTFKYITKFFSKQHKTSSLCQIFTTNPSICIEIGNY